MDTIVTLIEATVYDPVAAVTKVVRLTNRNDPRATTANGEAWLPILLSAPELSSNVFDGAFSGVGATDVSSFKVTLVDGLGDDLALLAWDGADVRIYAGDMTVLTTFPLIYRATGKGASRRGRLELEIDLASRDANLDINLLYLSYAGSGNLEGDAEIKGVLKPWVFGDAKFCRPVLIDAVRQIYQVSGYGPIEGVYNVFEGGQELGALFASHTDFNTFRDQTVPQGQWSRLNTYGLIKLGSQPLYEITCHAKGDTNLGATALTKMGDIATRILALTSQVPVQASSITAFNTAAPQPVNDYFDEQISVKDALARLLLSVGGYYTFNNAGNLILGRVRFGASTFDLSGSNDLLPTVMGVNQLPTSAPVWLLRVGAEECHFVHSSSDIVGSIAQLADDIAAAQETADGKNKVFPPSSQAPTGAISGDQWPDTSTSPATMRRFNGASWVATSNLITTAAQVPYVNGQTLEALRPGEIGANVTETRTSQAINGQGPGATATGPAVLNNYVPLGYNSIYNSRMQRGTYGWKSVTASNGSPSYSVAAGVNIASGFYGVRDVWTATVQTGGANWVQSGSSVYADILYTRTPWRSGGTVEDMKKFAVPVKPGDRVAVSALMAKHRCNTVLYALILDSSGTLITAPTWSGGRDMGATNGDPANFDRVGGLTNITPTNAAWLVPMVRMVATGEADPYAFVTEVMAAKVPADQSTLPEYSDGPDDPFADQTSGNTAAGFFNQGLLATLNSLANGSNFLTGFGPFSGLANLFFGNSNFLESSGGPLASLNNFKTSLGSAASFFNQGAFATINSAAYGSSFLTGFGLLSPLSALNFGSNFLLETSGGAQATLANFKTSSGIASGIASQGLFATLSSAAYGSSLLTGFGALAPLANVYFGSSLIREASGGANATLANFKTSSGIASGIASQGLFATLSSAAYGSNLLTGFGLLSPLDALNFGSGFLLEASGGAQATLANFKTEQGTAAAIFNQGWGATASQSRADNYNVPLGANSVYNSRLQRGTYGWKSGAVSTASGSTPSYTVSAGVNTNAGYYGMRDVWTARVLTGSTNWVQNGDLVYADAFYTRSTWGGGGTLDDLKKFATPIKAGDRVAISAAISRHRCNTTLYALLLDSSGALLSAPNWSGGRSLGAQNGDPANFDRVGGLINITDAGAAWCVPMVRMFASGQADPYVFITEVMVAKVPANQTTMPEYSDGPDDPFADQTGVNTASGFTGQGLFATLSSVGYGSSLLTGFGTLAGRADVFFGNTMIKEASGGATATLANFKTSSGVASAIASQGGFATISSLTLDSQFGGMIANRLAPYSGDANFLSAARMAWNEGGTIQGLKPGEVGANVTESRTASAIYNQGWGATASEVAASNAQVKLGQNRVVNSRLSRGMYGWRTSAGIQNGAGRIVTIAVDTIAPDYTGKRNVLQVALGAGTWTEAGSTYCDCMHSVPTSFTPTTRTQFGMAVATGDRIHASARMAPHRCYAQFFVFIYDKNGTLVQAPSVTVQPSEAQNGSNGDPANFQRVGFNTDVTHADAAYAFVVGRARPNGGADPYLFATEFMLCKVAAGQTAWPDYNDGPEDPVSDQTSANTAAGFLGQGGFATLSSIGYGNPMLTGFNTLATLDRVKLGVNGGMVNQDNDQWLTDANTITSNGTAASIASQGALATRGDVFFGNTMIKEASGGATATLANFKTSSGVAASIASQSAWATYTGISTTTMASKVQYLQTDGAMEASYIYKSGQDILSNRFPQEGGANVTENRSAAAIANQGGFATISTLSLDSQLSGLVGARLAPYSGDANYLSANRMAWNEGGTVQGLKPGEAGANVTESRTASAIYNQGWGATASEAVVSNYKVPSGMNRSVNSRFFKGAFGWGSGAAVSNSNGSGGPVSSGVNNPSFSGERDVYWARVQGTWTDNAQGTSYFEALFQRGQWSGEPALTKTYYMPVSAGDRIFFSAQLARHRCNTQLLCVIVDKDGNLVTAPSATGGRSGGGALGRITNFDRVANFYNVTEPTAAWAALVVRMLPNGGNDAYMFATEMMLSKVNPGQTEWPSYNDGPEDPTADQTSGNTAAGIASQGSLATRSDVFFSNAMIKETNGGATATLANFKTSSGVAASIASQSAWATYTALSTTTVEQRTQYLQTDGNLEATRIYKSGQDTLANRFPQEGGANVTENRTAAAFNGQGQLATRSSLGWTDALFTGRPQYLTDVVDRPGFPGEKSLRSDYIVNPSQNVALVSRWPQEGGANVTENRTASAINNQGSFATTSSISSANVASFFQLNAFRLDYNITRSDGVNVVTESLAITSLGISAGFASQGTLATMSSVGEGNINPNSIGVPVVVSGGNASVGTTMTTIVETSTIAIGDSTDGGCVIMFSATQDSGSQTDKQMYYVMYVSVNGGAFQTAKEARIGIDTNSGQTKHRMSVNLIFAVPSGASVSVFVQARSEQYNTGAASGAFVINGPTITILGAKR